MVELPKKNKLSLTNKIALWIHYLVILCLLISILSKYITPQFLWPPAFFGLAFPFIFLANIFLILFWLIQLKSEIFIGLIALMLSFTSAYRFIQFNFQETTVAINSIKVTSYNCNLFDLYNWKKNKKNRTNIFNNLNKINPDILCLQEFYTSEDKKNFNNSDSIKKLLKLNYFHSEYKYTLKEKNHWGISTFSKYQIINQGLIKFETKTNNSCIYSDILINKDTVRIYNIHLQSINFSKNDSKFYEDMLLNFNTNDEIENSKNIFIRLKKAFIKRSIQVDMIKKNIKNCKYKIILCGDFNDTPTSYAYERLIQNLDDSFVEKGNGIGKTYAGKWPQFRIDYIFYSKNLICTNYARSNETFTDHYPVTAFFDLKSFK